MYKHFLDGCLVYVGKGSLARAFSVNRRGDLWEEVVGEAQSIEVEVVGWYDDEATALLAEMALISTLQPPGNLDGTVHGEARLSEKALIMSQRRKRKREAEIAEASAARKEVESFHNVWGK